jgi:hypothetical protein
MPITKNRLISQLQVVILILLTLCYLSNISPVIYDDSPGYINFEPIRPPIYPIFIWLFHSFGSYQFTLVMWAQTLFTLAALLYARYWLYQRFKMPGNITFLITLFIMAMFGYYRTMQLICSEAIAFPIFIFTFFALMDCYKTLTLKRILVLTILVNLLILTRLQFYYFYLNYFLLLAWAIWKKIPTKQVWLSVIIITLSTMIGVATNRAYHYALNGRFSDAPAVGTQLVVQALYLADQSDAQYFTDPTEKAIFQRIMTKLEEKHYTEASEQSLLALSRQTTYAYYYAAYNLIMLTCYQNLPNLSVYQKDRFLLNMAKALYLNNLKKNLFFYALKIGSFFGGIPILLAYLLVLCFTMAGVMKSRNCSPDFSYVFTVVSLLTIFANTPYVTLFEPGQASYFFYSYFLLFCLSGLLAQALYAIP